MRIENITPGVTNPVLPSPNIKSIFGRLKQLAQDTQEQIAGAFVSPNQTIGGKTSPMTPDMLRDALLEFGASPDSQNMEIANALAQLGVPLTLQTLTEAHAASAAAPNASPLAFAFAKALGLPTTPAALQALTTLINGIPANTTLPANLQAQIGISLNAGLESTPLANQLRLIMNQLGRSTENLIVKNAIGQEQVVDIHDLRTMLLNLAEISGNKTISRNAGTLASHIEGQQLINQASLQAHDTRASTPLYFAIPIQFSNEQATIEMQVFPKVERREEEIWNEETAYLHANIRVATSRLGRIQVEIIGTAQQLLTCRVTTEKSATQRLIQQQSGRLAASLATLGWRVREITCLQTDHWPPLWYGGEEMSTPRTRIDWRA